MKQIFKSEEFEVPSDTTVTIKSRIVTVVGPRGTLQKNFRHIDMALTVAKSSDKAVKQATRVKLVVWHGGRKHVACLKTVKSEIENMITGVRRGYRYKMRLVYAHFPINCVIADDHRSVEIRNFLGEKIVRKIPMLAGVEIKESTAQKDEILIEGNDIDTVSQSAADIHGSCLVKEKDIRKFLDGIFVSERGNIVEDEE